ncbi:hypothetical protein F4810DRAFT_706471 [Camillea tinctor]|nr:hypothetical protein F4810DRAFT_706471 [Camillea tinctor]
MLIDLIQSFIVQHLLILPETTIATVDLSLERFEKLLDPELEFDDALQLLHDIRTLAPPYLHYIIEGAQGLEDRSDNIHMRNLLLFSQEIMQVPRTPSPDDSMSASSGRNNQPSKEKPEIITKVCVTTDGYVDILAELVEIGRIEKVEYEDEAEEYHAGEATDMMPMGEDEGGW